MNVTSLLTTLVALPAVAILVRAAVLWLRRRDPIDGQIALLFVPDLVFLVADLLWYATGRTDLTGPVAALALARAYQTLRIAGLLRPTARWLEGAALAAVLLLSVPMAAVDRPVPPAVGIPYAACFVAIEVAAARLFAAEARHRRGTPAVRLRVAAAATLLFAGAPLLAVVGTRAGLITDDGANHHLALTGPGVAVLVAYESCLVLSALGYLVAFVPPRWLREVWATRAANVVGERLLDAPPTEAAERLWRRYAGVVRDVTSADAVVVLLRDPAGALCRAGAAGTDWAPPPGLPAGALDALLGLRQPVAVGAARGAASRHAGGPLLADLAAGPGAGLLLTAVPLPPPRLAGGALVIANRTRGLFAGDDLKLVARIAVLCGVLAERSAVLADREAALAEQRRLGAELAASVRALTRADNAKRDFLAAMSHELRTPLNAIIGFSDLMRADLAPDDPHAAWIGHVHTSGRHLLALINELLDLSRVESGTMELDPADIRLDRLVRDLVSSLGPLLDPKRLRVAVEVPPMLVRVDPVRFRQILENLLANAIRYTPERGRITVAAGAAGPDLTVAVSDTGVGIAEADLDLIFDPFARVGAAGERSGGTGLGLAVVHRIVRAHGGDIAVASVPGAGSTFTVTVPGAALGPAAPDPPPAPGGVAAGLAAGPDGGC
ncbi:hypothetical protein GCM10010123_29880 [Pilimelia anulata]|uniref:histidine kinase n=1 Tax=Pilimelia anulata TaxID=53371 RepID=A0A8J3B6R0_9ACTN|nr:HAMP domain-containing sensor histidine kinase [Pilimelia anulata]GGJ97832.1 hypothetical protein GCM10010123_29880 [Pilimelia anulata]